MNVKIPSLFRLAKNISKNSSHKIQMGSVIVKSGHPISVGFNQIKSHPSGFRDRKSLHAEIHAIKNCDTNDFRGMSIFVYRESRKNKIPAMARPCEDCMKVLKEKGFKWIYYSTGEFPFWDCEKI